jgi:hypothetical protein
MHNPYFPIPYSPGMLDSVADGSTPQLIPHFTLADGSVLSPLVYFQHVKVTERGDRTVITFEQSHLDKLGTQSPVPDDRISVSSTYVFEPGRITRTDIYTPHGAILLKSLRMEFATYSDAASQQGESTFFGHGMVRKFTARGFEHCGVAPIQDDVAYHTPSGPYSSRVACESPERTLQGALKLGWTLSYQ